MDGRPAGRQQWERTDGRTAGNSGHQLRAARTDGNVFEGFFDQKIWEVFGGNLVFFFFFFLFFFKYKFDSFSS
jgi:hypothetical protein